MKILEVKNFMEDKKESDEKVNNKKNYSSYYSCIFDNSCCDIHCSSAFILMCAYKRVHPVRIYGNDLNDRRQGNRQPSRLQIWPRPGKIRCCNILCP